MRSKFSKPAFTLIELLVAMLISGLLIGLTASVYSLFRKSLAVDQGKVDDSQNARIAFDRISRELRQSPDIITPLPASPSDNSVAEPGAIEFENGHDNDLTYHYYYLSGSTLKMDTKQYYFASAPSVRVHEYSTDGAGNPPISNVISTVSIADHVQSVAFYGDQTILMTLVTADTTGQTYSLTTSVYRRNS